MTFVFERTVAVMWTVMIITSQTDREEWGWEGEGGDGGGAGTSRGDNDERLQ